MNCPKCNILMFLITCIHDDINIVPFWRCYICKEDYYDKARLGIGENL